MESGSLVVFTQEVRDLVACLRAIDDPSDEVALVAALRSPAYACSDVDLLRWVEGDGRLHYLRPGRSLAGC
jgi:ATP-dependent helicase/nuclease subunit A